MPEGLDNAVAEFQQAIDPSPRRDTPVPPRDESGRFVQTQEKAEPLFQIRMVEGDPETGDTSDGGDDSRLRARERDIADGRHDERAEREAAENAKDVRRTAAATGDDVRSDEEQGDAEADESVDEESADEEQDLENAKFEVTVDGEQQTVSFGELRDGYIRTATFHSRLNKVNEQKQAVEQEHTRVGQLRDLFINGLQVLDQDLQAMVPAEPNWDEEFAKDPRAAHLRQKEFQAFNSKLQQIRVNRAWAEQNKREEHDRAAAKYAVDQFTEFVHDHPKLIKDEASLQRVIGGMRKTALAEGFSETEVAGVYDKRMLSVLLKAWLYDQGMAVKPQAALPGPGKALVPGSARPINGSAVRRNIDEAQRRLERTGSLEDATAVFQRLIR